MHSHSADGSGFFTVYVEAAVGLAVLAYLLATFRNRRRRSWPVYRAVLWISGLAALLTAVAGPVAEAGHESFAAHMVTHLLLGMVAPLLLVLAAPLTLALRTLDVVPARRLSAVLRTRPARFLSHPVTATALNVGGLWILYTTPAFPAMHENMLLMAVIQVHVLFAGYLFTASMISVDPIPHRPGYLYRAIVLVVALAGHGILSKYLYAHPPAGVPAAQAELGSMIMYYGGDAVDLVLIILLCSRWFSATRPRPVAGVPA